MKRLNNILTLCFYFWSTLFFAQVNKPDEVLKSVSSLKTDTAKCKQLIIEIEKETNSKFWLKYNTELERLAQKGITQKTNSLKLQQTYLGFLATAINNKGFYYEESGNIDSALSFYRRALDIRYDIKDKDGISNAFNNIGYLYYRKSDYETAMLYYQKAYTIQKARNDEGGLSALLNNIGTVYLNQKNYDSALVYFKRSLTIRMNAPTKDSIGISSGMMNIASVYFSINKKDSALILNLQAAEIKKRINDKSGLANCYNSIGVYYAETDQNQLAIDYLERSSQYYIETDNKSLISRPLNVLGSLYLKMRNISLAKASFEKSLAIAKQVGYPALIAKPANELYKIYKNEGNTAKALPLLELSIKMQDSINKINKLSKEGIGVNSEGLNKTKEDKDSLVVNQKLSKLQIKTNELVSAVSKQTKLIYTLVITLLLALGGFVYFYWLYRTKK
jgi:tetratricopeptide (TPR) repeat protein